MTAAVERVRRVRSRC